MLREASNEHVIRPAGSSVISFLNASIEEHHLAVSDNTLIFHGTNEECRVRDFDLTVTASSALKLEVKERKLIPRSFRLHFQKIPTTRHEVVGTCALALAFSSGYSPAGLESST